ncbi:MAG: hypothetical protein AAGB11_17020 [Pseudomonadota bacterium]
MRPLVLVGTLVALLVFAVAPPKAQAQQTFDCAPDALVSLGKSRVVKYYDADPKGVSIGDVRVGKRDLENEDGNSVGELRWRVTPLNAGDDPDHVALIRRFFMLPEGMIIAEGIYSPQATINDTSKISITDGVSAVLGGTGKYRSASGVMTVTPRADGEPQKNRYVFDVNC